MVLICRGSRELAAQMLASIEGRMQHSHAVLHEGAVTASQLWRDASLLDRTKMWLGLPLSSMFDFLL
jgi:hypothetical protein